MSEARERGLLAAAAAALVAVPFLAVRYPPITDLPQDAAQIRLFLDTLGHAGGPYAIQWLTPYDPPRTRPWTERLEWRPERVQGSDFRYSGYVRVGGGDAVHGYEGRYLQPVTTQGTWRLYRVPAS